MLESLNNVYVFWAYMPQCLNTYLKHDFVTSSTDLKNTTTTNTFFPLPGVRHGFAQETVCSISVRTAYCCRCSQHRSRLSSPLIYTAAGYRLGITRYKKQYNVVSNNTYGVDKLGSRSDTHLQERQHHNLHHQFKQPVWTKLKTKVFFLHKTF